jgi:hypothetical protein
MYHNVRCGWETSPIEQKIEGPDHEKVDCYLPALVPHCRVLGKEDLELDG